MGLAMDSAVRSIKLTAPQMTSKVNAVCWMLRTRGVGGMTSGKIVISLSGDFRALSGEPAPHRAPHPVDGCAPRGKIREPVRQEPPLARELPDRHRSRSFQPTVALARSSRQGPFRTANRSSI